MLSAVQRVRRGQKRPWEQAEGSWSNFAAACEAARCWSDGIHGGADGLWKTPPSSSSVPGRFKILQCNRHIGCPVLQKIAKNESTGLFERFTAFEHATELKLTARENSALTYKQHELLSESLDTGGKAAGILSTLTRAESKAMKKRGLNPMHFKKPDGGLEGMMNLIHSNTLLIQRDTHVIHVYYVT